MNKNILRKLLDHPDRDEIIAKLVIDCDVQDIHDWLAEKYSNVGDAKLILSTKNIKTFKDNYLDVYTTIRDDIVKTKQAVSTNTQNELELAIQNNPTYRGKMLELANKELDVRQMVAHLCAVIETRFGQIFDEIQADPRNINTRVDRVLIDYGELLGNLLEKYYKFTEGPADLVIQHNVALQAIDQHIVIFHDVIKEILSNLDLESSMLFVELFNDKIGKLKLNQAQPLNTDAKLVEAKILNETINRKLNN